MLTSPTPGVLSFAQPQDSNVLSSSPLVLLGQFQILGQADVDWSTSLRSEEAAVMDIASDATQAIIDRAPVVWLDHDGNEEMPLIESTKKALGVMGYQIPVRGGGGVQSKEATTATEDVSGHTEETVNAITDDEIDVDDEMEAEKTGFEHFERALNVCSLLQSALKDIRFMKREEKDRTTPLTGKGKHKHNREMALEKQRETLQKRQEQGKKEEPVIAVSDSGDEGDDNANDSLLVLARAINSLSVLTPCILQMWQHPRRRETKLRIAGYSIKKKNKSTHCWMLFHNVGDIATNKQVWSLVDDLKNIYLVLGMASPTIWKDTDGFVQSQCEGTIRQLIESIGEHQADDELSLPKWTRIMPLASINDVDRAMKSAAKLDLSLDLERSAEEARKRTKYEACVQGLSRHLEGILKQRYNSARLAVYGSCLSDLSLGRGADVDMSLYIPDMAKDREDFQKGTTAVTQYQKRVKNKVYETCRLLERRTNEFRDFTPVTRARVPVVKGTYTRAQNPYSDDGSIDFDICFLNDIAVANSELLRQYSLVEPRVKHLMMSVKRWAKQNKISSSMDSCISSYAWMNLAIFYLQCLGFVPNLQCPDLREKAGVKPDGSDHWHHVESLDTFFLKWDEARTHWDSPSELRNVPVAALLFGFFRFYVIDFPSALYMISIRRGAGCRFLKLETFTKSNHFFQIEDPFETFDSHKPHDLGMHANDVGATKIMNCLREAARGMERMLMEQGENLNLDFLWSGPSESDAKQQPKKKKAQNNRGNGQADRGGPNRNRGSNSGGGTKATEVNNAGGGHPNNPPQSQPVTVNSDQEIVPPNNRGASANQNGQRNKKKKKSGGGKKRNASGKAGGDSRGGSSNGGGGSAVATGEGRPNQRSEKTDRNASENNAPRTGRNGRRNRQRNGGGQPKGAEATNDS